MTDAVGLQQTLFDLSRKSAATSIGVVQSIDWAASLVNVDVGGTPMVMPWTGQPPWVGDTVRVLTVGKQRWCEAVLGAPLGTAVTTTSGIVTVDGDDGRQYKYPWLTEAPGTGNRVRLDHAGRVVTGVLGGADADTDDPDSKPLPPSGSTVTRTFQPSGSQNYRYGGAAGSAVEVSISRSGFYFYGNQIASTIPDGATITAATIRLVENWDQIPGTPSLLGTHTAQTQPGSPPTLSGSIPVTGGGNIDILSFADALKTGAAYGVGFAVNGGWRQFAPYSSSGAITITWRG